MVRPGTGSVSPVFQSRTTPPGVASASGVSCCSGAATRSLRTPSRGPASSEKTRAMPWKASKSVRVCHGGLIAGVNAWMNGCMSVVLRSCFSYQVAAGSTTSENRVVEVIRKSSDSSRSSLPSGASSCQVTSLGRRSGGASSARRDASVPSRCRRKYSLPFAEEPSRLARHTVSTRGQLRGASGSVQANPSRPPASSRATCPAGSSGLAARASSATSRGLRSKVGIDGIQPSRADWASRSAVWRPANAPLARGEVSASAV